MPPPGSANGVCRLFAETYGRLNHDWVETIFRYKHRWQKGICLATLAGTIPKAEALGGGRLRWDAQPVSNLRCNLRRGR